MAETTGNLWFPYTPMKGLPPPLQAVGTQGTRILLADGRELIDGIASWWTACHGYNHPHIVAAMEAQLGAMPHVMFGGMVHEPAMRLARRLAGLLGQDLNHVFFSDSGSVSVEIGLKMAIQYWRNSGVEGRDRFVCFRGAYHGDTLGAMSVCDPEDGMHRLLGNYVPSQIVLDLPLGRAGLEAFERAVARHAGEIAAVVIEPLVQAAGGMRFHPPETLAAVADVCREHGQLLILDEIATGFGRTGTMFAFGQAEISPDIVCLSKALTGGTMGLAATVANERVYSAFDSEDPKRALMHGPTFMANPLGCAAANASLDLFEREPRLEQARGIEAHLRESLEPCRAMPRVVDVRVLGAVGVVELDRIDDLAGMRMRFVNEGVWIRPLENVVYLMPPLVVPPEELDILAGAIRRVVGELA